MADLIECTVSPGRIVHAGPPDSDGICRESYGPGDVVQLTPADAACMRENGTVLMADGSQRLSGM